MTHEQDSPKPLKIDAGIKGMRHDLSAMAEFLLMVVLLFTLPVTIGGGGMLLLADSLWAAGGEAPAWHPFSLSWNDAPLNLSFLLDAPAGKHGFLGIKNQRFVFEDGKEARFWGVTLSGSACFPAPEQAPVIADRLARFGVNLVRLHQLDADWAEPNLFAAPDQPGVFFNPETLDRLDYFLFQLENRGIYVWLGGLASRRLKESDGIPAWQYIPLGLKGYIYFVPEIQNLHRQYLQALWSHRNRYTGLEYRDSPAIVLTDLFYDNNLHIDPPRLQPFAGLFENLWRDWQAARKEMPPIPFDYGSPTPEMQQFMADVMGRANVAFHNFLRSISVKIPLAGTGAVTALRDLPILEPMDFIQAGGLWNPPRLGRKIYSNRRMVDTDPDREANLFHWLAFSRLEKKPFVASMWGCPWPSAYRAELPLWMAAMAAWQDWQGCVLTSSLSTLEPENTAITGPLENWNDPAVWGLMPAAALLFHRKTMEPARPLAVMGVPDSLLFSEAPLTPAECRTTRLADQARITVRLRARPGRSSILSPTQPESVQNGREKTKTRRELRHDPRRGLVWVDTKQAQAVIGRLREAANEEPAFLNVQSDVDFGVVCVNSLDGLPIPQSRDLWITVISEAQNQDFRSMPVDGDFQIESPGQAPVLIQDTPVRLFLETRQTGWILRTVDGAGREGAPLPYQIENNRLSFQAGIHGSIYYRLSCQPASEA